MDWRYGEPALADVLSDPIVQVLMARDQVECRALADLLSEVRARPAGPGVEPSQPDEC